MLRNMKIRGISLVIAFTLASTLSFHKRRGVELVPKAEAQWSYVCQWLEEGAEWVYRYCKARKASMQARHKTWMEGQSTKPA